MSNVSFFSALVSLALSLGGTTRIFVQERGGFAAPARYSLVFQGRCNRCDNADDFTHWRLEISGKKPAYAFFGELASARPAHAEQRESVHDAIVEPNASTTEEEKE